MLDRNKYDQFRVAPTDPALLRATDVERLLKELVARSGGRLTMEKFAESVEGRSIYLARIGTGPKRILLWSQMHGDEPTHTAVLLDLASYLLRTPAEPQAADILKNCTLHFIPMLNPDGAEAIKRYNAQGIDINRDARRLATPEARALRKATETVKPEFAFNLHNQHARTSVGHPPKPAAVSVLAPAPDRTRKETPGMRRAKLMCACFVEAVRPDVRGMISRYDDTHEPRAFGDTIQATGAATMLVEAGGWTDADIEPLTRVHFHGMLTTIHAIATDEYLKSDLNVYETLPESNSVRQLDWLITSGQVITSLTPAPFTADLGISQTRTERLGGREQSDGRIVEIGDLSTLSAKSNLYAAGSVLLPGQIVYAENWSPTSKQAPENIDFLLSRGVTTILGNVDLADADAITAINSSRELPLNWGFIGRLEKAAKLRDVELVENVAAAASRGLLAVATAHANEDLWQKIDRVGLPLVRLSQLEPSTAPASYQKAADEAAALAKILGLYPNRGRISRDAYADFALIKPGKKPTSSDAIDWPKLTHVVVAGETVWEEGKRTNVTPGVHLRRT